LPEAEAELVAGFNVEYSSINFALFFLGEYSSMLLLAAVSVILFLAGNSLINTQFFFGLFLFFAIIKNNIYNSIYIFLSDLLEKLDHYLKIHYKKNHFLDIYFPTTVAAKNLLSIFTLLILLFIYTPLALSISSDTTVLNYILHTIIFFLVGIPFSSKVVLFGFFFILVRANVPRYRFDQLLAIS
jgi:NADH:ubiquinone oxidoreductase subunit H